MSDKWCSWQGSHGSCGATGNGCFGSLAAASTRSPYLSGVSSLGSGSRFRLSDVRPTRRDENKTNNDFVFDNNTCVVLHQRRKCANVPDTAPVYSCKGKVCLCNPESELAPLDFDRNRTATYGLQTVRCTQQRHKRERLR